MPGHVLRRVSCSDDYVYASISISAEMVSELKGHTFSHDSDKFNYAPKCHLTDVQVKRMMALLELLETIASHDRNDLQVRRPLGGEPFGEDLYDVLRPGVRALQG